MQNKGAITTFAVLLGLACLFYLSFTWVTRGVEKDAAAFADTYIANPIVKKAAANLHRAGVGEGAANRQNAAARAGVDVERAAVADVTGNRLRYPRVID